MSEGSEHGVGVCVRRVCVCCGCQVPFHAQIECLSGLVGTSAWARAKRGARGEGRQQEWGCLPPQ